MAPSMEVSRGGHHSRGSLERTRAALSAEHLRGAMLVRLGQARGWVYSEYCVAILLDVRRTDAVAPWVLAAVERVLRVLAKGPRAVFGQGEGWGEGAPEGGARLHISLVACARGTEQMRTLLHGWTISVGEPIEPLLVRAWEELACLSRVTATVRASSRGGLPIVGGGSRDRQLSSNNYGGASRTTQGSVVTFCPAVVGGAAAMPGVGPDAARAGNGQRRSRGLASCVQQGLFALSMLPTAGCPAIALITDGVSSLSYAPPLALRWRDTSLFIVLPPPGRGNGPSSGRPGEPDASGMAPSSTRGECRSTASSAGGEDGQLSSVHRCVDAFGLINDYEGLEIVAEFANGLIVQMPASVAAATAQVMARRKSWASSASGEAVRPTLDADLELTDGLNASRPHGASLASSPDTAIARALMWRVASERCCVASHRAALSSATPAEWRLRAGLFWDLSARAIGANASTTLAAMGSRPLVGMPRPEPRHKERLHQYDVGTEVSISDLLSLRVREGFTVVLPQVDLQKVGKEEAGSAGVEGHMGSPSGDGGGENTAWGETQLRVVLEWVQNVTIEYMVRRRSNGVTPSPFPAGGGAHSVAAVGVGRLANADGSTSCNAECTTGSSTAMASNGARPLRCEPSPEARLRVAISVTAPLAFWVQYERLRSSRRYGGQPELSDAMALEHFTDGVRLRDQRLSSVAATFAVPRAARDASREWQRNSERDYVLLPPIAADLSLVPPPRPPPTVQLKLTLVAASCRPEAGAAKVSTSSGAGIGYAHVSAAGFVASASSTPRAGCANAYGSSAAFGTFSSNTSGYASSCQPTTAVAGAGCSISQTASRGSSSAASCRNAPPIFTSRLVGRPQLGSSSRQPRPVDASFGAVGPGAIAPLGPGVEGFPASGTRAPTSPSGVRLGIRRASTDGGMVDGHPVQPCSPGISVRRRSGSYQSLQTAAGLARARMTNASASTLNTTSRPDVSRSTSPTSTVAHPQLIPLNSLSGLSFDDELGDDEVEGLGSPAVTAAGPDASPSLDLHIKSHVRVIAGGAPAQRLALARLIAELRRLLPMRLGASTYACRWAPPSEKRFSERALSQQREWQSSGHAQSSGGNESENNKAELPLAPKGSSERDEVASPAAFGGGISTPKASHLATHALGDDAPAALVVRLLHRPNGLIFLRACGFRCEQAGGARNHLLTVWRSVVLACDVVVQASGGFVPLDSPAAIATRANVLLYASLGGPLITSEADSQRDKTWRRRAAAKRWEAEAAEVNSSTEESSEESESEEEYTTEGEDVSREEGEDDEYSDEDDDDGYYAEGKDWGGVWGEGEGEGPGDLEGRRDGARADSQRWLRMALWRRQWRWPLSTERMALLLVGLLMKARLEEGWWCADVERLTTAAERAAAGEGCSEALPATSNTHADGGSIGRRNPEENIRDSGEGRLPGSPPSISVAAVHMCHAVALEGGGACLLQYVARATRATERATEAELRRAVEVSLWVEPVNDHIRLPSGMSATSMPNAEGNSAVKLTSAALFWRLAWRIAEIDSHLAGGVSCTVSDVPAASTTQIEGGRAAYTPSALRACGSAQGAEGYFSERASTGSIAVVGKTARRSGTTGGMAASCGVSGGSGAPSTVNVTIGSARRTQRSGIPASRLMQDSRARTSESCSAGAPTPQRTSTSATFMVHSGGGTQAGPGLPEVDLPAHHLLMHGAHASVDLQPFSLQSIRRPREALALSSPHSGHPSLSSTPDEDSSSMPAHAPAATQPRFAPIPISDTDSAAIVPAVCGSAATLTPTIKNPVDPAMRRSNSTNLVTAASLPSFPSASLVAASLASVGEGGGCGSDAVNIRASGYSLPLRLLREGYEEMLAAACDARVHFVESACATASTLQQLPSPIATGFAAAGIRAGIRDDTPDGAPAVLAQRPEPRARVMARELLRCIPRQRLDTSGASAPVFGASWASLLALYPGQLLTSSSTHRREPIDDIDDSTKAVSQTPPPPPLTCFVKWLADGSDTAALAWITTPEDEAEAHPEAASPTNAGTATQDGSRRDVRGIDESPVFSPSGSANTFRLNVCACSLSDLKAPPPADPFIAELLGIQLAQNKAASASIAESHIRDAAAHASKVPGMMLPISQQGSGVQGFRRTPQEHTESLTSLREELRTTPQLKMPTDSISCTEAKVRKWFEAHGTGGSPMTSRPETSVEGNPSCASGSPTPNSLCKMAPADPSAQPPSDASLRLAQQLCDHALCWRGAVFTGALLSGMRAGFAPHLPDVMYAAKQCEVAATLRLPIGDLLHDQRALAELEAGFDHAMAPDFSLLPRATPWLRPQPLGQPADQSSQIVDGNAPTQLAAASLLLHSSPPRCVERFREAQHSEIVGASSMSLEEDDTANSELLSSFFFSHAGGLLLAQVEVEVGSWSHVASGGGHSAWPLKSGGISATISDIFCRGRTGDTLGANMNRATSTPRSAFSGGLDCAPHGISSFQQRAHSRAGNADECVSHPGDVAVAEGFASILEDETSSYPALLSEAPEDVELRVKVLRLKSPALVSTDEGSHHLGRGQQSEITGVLEISDSKMLDGLATRLRAAGASARLVALAAQWASSSSPPSRKEHSASVACANTCTTTTVAQAEHGRGDAIASTDDRQMTSPRLNSAPALDELERIVLSVQAQLPLLPTDRLLHTTLRLPLAHPDVRALFRLSLQNLKLPALDVQLTAVAGVGVAILRTCARAPSTKGPTDCQPTAPPDTSTFAPSTVTPPGGSPANQCVASSGDSSLCLSAAPASGMRRTSSIAVPPATTDVSTQGAPSAPTPPCLSHWSQRGQGGGDGINACGASKAISRDGSAASLIGAGSSTSSLLEAAPNAYATAIASFASGSANSQTALSDCAWMLLRPLPVEGADTDAPHGSETASASVPAAAASGISGTVDVEDPLVELVDVTVAGAPMMLAMAALAAAEAAVRRALDISTKRVLLRQVDEVRLPDDRLLPGGKFGLDELRCETFELHERLLADKSRALRALRAALSPFSVACDDGSLFVYRQMGSDATFLLQLTLREEEVRVAAARPGGPSSTALPADGSPSTSLPLTRNSSVSVIAPSTSCGGMPESGTLRDSRPSTPTGSHVAGVAGELHAATSANEDNSGSTSSAPPTCSGGQVESSVAGGGGAAPSRAMRKRRLFVELRVLGLTESDALGLSHPEPDVRVRDEATEEADAPSKEPNPESLMPRKARPLADITDGLMSHLALKMDELVLATLSMLMQRNPDLRLSSQDVRFLCPPSASPLASAIVELPPVPIPRHASTESPQAEHEFDGRSTSDWPPLSAPSSPKAGPTRRTAEAAARDTAVHSSRSELARTADEDLFGWAGPTDAEEGLAQASVLSVTAARMASSIGGAGSCGNVEFSRTSCSIRGAASASTTSSQNHSQNDSPHTEHRNRLLSAPEGTPSGADAWSAWLPRAVSAVRGGGWRPINTAALPDSLLAMSDSHSWSPGRGRPLARLGLTRMLLSPSLSGSAKRGNVAREAIACALVTLWETQSPGVSSSTDSPPAVDDEALRVRIFAPPPPPDSLHSPEVSAHPNPGSVVRYQLRVHLWARGDGVVTSGGPDSGNVAAASPAVLSELGGSLSPAPYIANGKWEVPGSITQDGGGVGGSHALVGGPIGGVWAPYVDELCVQLGASLAEARLCALLSSSREASEDGVSEKLSEKAGREAVDTLCCAHALGLWRCRRQTYRWAMPSWAMSAAAEAVKSLATTSTRSSVHELGRPDGGRLNGSEHVRRYPSWAAAASYATGPLLQEDDAFSSSPPARRPRPSLQPLAPPRLFYACFLPPANRGAEVLWIAHISRSGVALAGLEAEGPSTTSATPLAHSYVGEPPATAPTCLSAVDAALRARCELEDAASACQRDNGGGIEYFPRGSPGSTPRDLSFHGGSNILTSRDASVHGGNDLTASVSSPPLSSSSTPNTSPPSPHPPLAHQQISGSIQSIERTIVRAAGCSSVKGAGSMLSGAFPPSGASHIDAPAPAAPGPAVARLDLSTSRGSCCGSPRVGKGGNSSPAGGGCVSVATGSLHRAIGLALTLKTWRIPLPSLPNEEAPSSDHSRADLAVASNATLQTCIGACTCRSMGTAAQPTCAGGGACPPLPSSTTLTTQAAHRAALISRLADVVTTCLQRRRPVPSTRVLPSMPILDSASGKMATSMASRAAPLVPSAGSFKRMPLSRTPSMSTANYGNSCGLSNPSMIGPSSAQSHVPGEAANWSTSAAENASPAARQIRSRAQALLLVTKGLFVGIFISEDSDGLRCEAALLGSADALQASPSVDSRTPGSRTPGAQSPRSTTSAPIDAAAPSQPATDSLCFGVPMLSDLEFAFGSAGPPRGIEDVLSDICDDSEGAAYDFLVRECLPLASLRLSTGSSVTPPPAAVPLAGPSAQLGPFLASAMANPPLRARAAVVPATPLPLPCPPAMAYEYFNWLVEHPPVLPYSMATVASYHAQPPAVATAISDSYNQRASPDLEPALEAVCLHLIPCGDSCIGFALPEPWSELCVVAWVAQPDAPLEPSSPPSPTAAGPRPGGPRLRRSTRSTHPAMSDVAVQRHAEVGADAPGSQLPPHHQTSAFRQTEPAGGSAGVSAATISRSLLRRSAMTFAFGHSGGGHVSSGEYPAAAACASAREAAERESRDTTSSHLPAERTSQGVPSTPLPAGASESTLAPLLHLIVLAPRRLPDAMDFDNAVASARDVAAWLLRSQWDSFRSFRSWRDLRRGVLAAQVSADTEIASFIERLPSAFPLEQVYPSLQPIRGLRLPWNALIGYLVGLPLNSCRWRDADGRDHLLLVLEPPTMPLFSASPSQREDVLPYTAHETAAAASGAFGRPASAAPLDDGGFLLHLSSGKSGMLRSRVHSSSRVARARGMATPILDEVVRAILCWVWEKAVAEQDGGAEATDGVTSAGLAASGQPQRAGITGWFQRARTVQGLF